MTACEHESFEAAVDVNRITAEEGGPVTGFSCDVRVRCTACGEPLVFHGVPVGLLSDRPTINPSGTELRAPCRPQSSDPHFGLGLPGFVARVAEGEQGHNN